MRASSSSLSYSASLAQRCKYLCAIRCRLWWLPLVRLPPLLLLLRMVLHFILQSKHRLILSISPSAKRAPNRIRRKSLLYHQFINQSTYVWYVACVCALCVWANAGADGTGVLYYNISSVHVHAYIVIYVSVVDPLVVPPNQPTIQPHTLSLSSTSYSNITTTSTQFLAHLSLAAIAAAAAVAVHIVSTPPSFPSVRFHLLKHFVISTHDAVAAANVRKDRTLALSV